jgi:hypothetical protein
MTKISFTDEHLSVILRALEVYSRLRSGQIKIAMEEAYSEYQLSWDEADSIEKFVRRIIFPSPPELGYDGHGGYWDQYGNTYDETGNRDSEITWEEKCREKRPHLQGDNAYYGVGSKEMNESGATLAYEVYSTIRQYVSLRNNDGYSELVGTQFRDPLHLTDVPLPIIENFTKEKVFEIKGKALVNKLNKLEDSKNWNVFWDTIDLHLKKKYPELGGWDEARAERQGTKYLIKVKGARKIETKLQ